MAKVKQKIVWSNPTGQAELPTEVHKAYHPPGTVNLQADTLDARNPGAMFFVVGSTDISGYYDTLQKFNVAKSPHRWLTPAYSGYNGPENHVKSKIGLYLGTERVSEFKSIDSRMIVSRLRHKVMVEGEVFFVHNAWGMVFMDEDDGVKPEEV